MRYWGAEEVRACLAPPGRTAVGDFETEFASYIGVPHVTATRYARTALYLALGVADARGREVLLPAFTCNVVRDAVCLAGAAPVFVDIDPADLSLDLDDLKRKTSDRSRCLIITHYYGRAAGNYEAQLSYARETGLVAIEDCAHCLGLTHQGWKVGTLGDMAAFSLGKSTLNFSGGLLVCRDRAAHERARDLMQTLSRRSNWTHYGIMYPVVNGGFVPLLERTVFNQPGRRASKLLMRWGVRTGNAVMNCVPGRRARALTVDGGRGDGLMEVRHREAAGGIDGWKRQYFLTMPGVVAQLGRAQLRKLDFFNRRRVEVCQALLARLGCGYPRSAAGPDAGSTYSYLAMSFEGADIRRIRDLCAERGLPLQTTWPGHQEYWPEQLTRNVCRVRDSLLLWPVNPAVGRRDIEEMGQVLAGCVPPGPAPGDERGPVT